MRRFLLFLLLGLFVTTAFAQTPSARRRASGLWQTVDESAMLRAVAPKTNIAARRNIVPQVYRTLELNRPALVSRLASAPLEFSGPMEVASVQVELPLPDGRFGRFNVQESPVMEPELAAKFPEIKTYVGQGIDDPAAVVRLDLTPRGFHAMILSARGAVFVDPYWRDSDLTYVVYNKSDFASDKNFQCLVPPNERKAIANSAQVSRPSGATLKKYRLALGCTGEYATYVCSPNAPTVLATLSAMITSVNRVSGVYERDFAIRLILAANNDRIVYTNASTDPYTNSNPSSLLTQNQTTCDGQIGSANYDIGHVFSTGGGGLAALGVVCRAGLKAQGETGTSAPLGDPYDIDYVAHEMGHQFGGNHTFNSTVNNCSGNRNASTAYETGSGITIMAYAGICSTGSVITDLAAHSDDYFHTGSYTEIDNYTTTGSGAGCAVTQATGNHPPVIAAVSASTIPINTPFALTASATDVDGDTLTYCWEEFDIGSAQTTAAPSSSGTNPVLRSFAPTLDPKRVFPALTYILNNANTPPATVGGFSTGEILPTVSRTMNFRVTVRDNHAGAGGSDWAATTVTTSSLAGPFIITAPNTASTIAGGSLQTVSWNVANTNAAPVNCANVKIALSTDGGNTFPIVLANSVPNNDSASVTIPNTANVATTQGRIKVEAVGNIFFDISDANLTITSTNTPPTLAVTGGLTLVRGTPGAVNATVATAGGANAPFTALVSNVPYGINLTPGLAGNSVSLSGTADCRVVTTLTSRTYPVTLTLTDSVGSTVSSSVNVVVQPNATPTVGDYPAGNVSAGTAIDVTPATPPADGDNNLPAAPLLVSPTTVPGGGTVAINQTTGVVTIATTSGSTVGPFTVRVTLADTCGATLLKEFPVNVTVPIIAFTSSPPPSPVIVGTPYSHTFTASGSPAPTFSLTSGSLPPGLTLAANGLLSGTPTSAGTGTFANITVKASNGVAPDVSQTFSLSAVTRVANCLAGYGLTGGDAAPLFDFDFDGISNLLEYALGLNPTIASRVGLPSVFLKDYAGTTYLAMIFPRSSVATDLTYTVQASGDLQTWSDLASSVAGGTTSGAGLVSESGAAPSFNVEVRDLVPFNPSTPAPRFLRLQVTSP